MSQRRPLSLLSAALVVASAWMGAPALAEEPGLNDTQRTEVLQMMRTFIINNPDLLAQAVGNDTQQDQAADELITRAPDKARNAFLDPNQGISLNPGGAPTIIVAFDYDCPVCRILSQRMREAIRRHPGANVVLRDTPILSAGSEMAAKVGLAIAAQGSARYVAYHFALMERHGPLNEQSILNAATASGADMSKVAVAAASPSIAATLEVNRARMRGMGTAVTPMIGAGGKVFVGAPLPLEIDAMLTVH